MDELGPCSVETKKDVWPVSPSLKGRILISQRLNCPLKGNDLGLLEFRGSYLVKDSLGRKLREVRVNKASAT